MVRLIDADTLIKELKDSMGEIILGDCFEILKSIGNQRFDVTFTSPPYNRKRNDKYAHYDDTLDDYEKFLTDFTNEALRVTKRHVIVNIQSNYYNRAEVFAYMGKFAKLIREVIIWEKTNPMPASGMSVTNAYEMFVILGNEPLKSNTTYTKNHFTTSVNSKMPAEHKAVMHQDASDFMISKFTREGDVILDPFGGIGTTAVSAKKYGRKFVIIEKEPKYVEMAKRRIYASE